MALNDRQKRFVLAYVDTLNATEAAKQAGYSPKTAQEQGSRLLSNVMVRAEVDRLFEERAMGKGELLARLTEIARGTAEDFLVVQGDDDASIAMPNFARAKERGKLGLIQQFKIGKDGEISFKLYSKQDALKTLAKIRGLMDSKLPEDDSDEDKTEETDEVGDEALRVESRLLEAADGGSGNSETA